MRKPKRIFIAIGDHLIELAAQQYDELDGAVGLAGGRPSRTIDDGHVPKDTRTSHVGQHAVFAIDVSTHHGNVSAHQEIEFVPEIAFAANGLAVGHVSERSLGEHSLDGRRAGARKRVVSDDSFGKRIRIFG